MLTVTDDMDVAGYSLRPDGKSLINVVSLAELQALPEWVMDGVNIGIPIEHNGILYGDTEKSLTEEPLWSKS